jgi:hypothetical protein
VLAEGEAGRGHQRLGGMLAGGHEIGVGDDDGAGGNEANQGELVGRPRERFGNGWGHGEPERCG